MVTAVKFAEGSDTLIEGLAIPFGGPFAGKDFHGERFVPETDIVPDLYPHGRPIVYHHGVNKDMGLVVQGRQTEHEVRDEGIWAKGELDKSARYHATVAKMIREGKLFFSSGAWPHMVKTRADGTIERWPWSELSLTPTPANPDAVVAYAVKAADLLAHFDAAGIDIPAETRTIIDSERGSAPEPFAVHAARMSDALDGFADRALVRHEVRAKAGRVLSASNRADIEAVVEAIDAALAGLGERRAKLAELLSRSDPKADEARKAAEIEYLRFLREQARANGVRVNA